METKQKHKVTPESAYAWLVKRQQRKRELQEQFQKDCDSGRIDEILKNGKPVNQ